MSEQPYMKKVIELAQAAAEKGQVIQVDVKHDNWCKIYKGKTCDCNFEIKIRGDA